METEGRSIHRHLYYNLADPQPLNARLYPNFLAFFHKLISTPPPSSSPYAGRKSSVVPVLEKYLLGGEGEMLVRCLSGALHPLIHIGHGIEFKLDAIVAEGQFKLPQMAYAAR